MKHAENRNVLRSRDFYSLFPCFSRSCFLPLFLLPGTPASLPLASFTAKLKPPDTWIKLFFPRGIRLRCRGENLIPNSAVGSTAQLKFQQTEHCHLVPQIEGETPLSLYTTQSSCFFSSHSTGHILISTNSKMQLSLELLERNTGKHLSTLTRICTKTSDRHTDPRQILQCPQSHSGADYTSSKPADQPDTGRVHTAKQGGGYTL